MTQSSRKEDAKEKRETAIQYLKIISYSLWLVIAAAGIVIAFKYAQVMDHVSGMMGEAAASFSQASDSSDYSDNSGYDDSSDY